MELTDPDKTDLLEQKCHDLDSKLRILKEERRNLMSENEDLSEKLLHTNEMNRNESGRIHELTENVESLKEEVVRLDQNYGVFQDHLKFLNEKLMDVSEWKEDIKQLKQDSSNMREEVSSLKSHYKITAKLELQSKENLYESRLLHLENVLEEMKQREAYIMRVVDETNVLKDQVDHLRELSIAVSKHELGNNVATDTRTHMEVEAVKTELENIQRQLNSYESSPELQKGFSFQSVKTEESVEFDETPSPPQPAPQPVDQGTQVLNVEKRRISDPTQTSTKVTGNIKIYPKVSKDKAESSPKKERPPCCCCGAFDSFSEAILKFWLYLFD